MPYHANLLGLQCLSSALDMICLICNVQGLDIPDDLKALYKTVWELRQRTLVEMAADRGAFIDQSQSFNVHMSDPNFGKLTSLHFHAWKVQTDHLPVSPSLWCSRSALAQAPQTS